MAITKTIVVDGQEVKLRASAAIPRIYRNKFGRDIYKDLDQLQAAVKGSLQDQTALDSFSLELFENLAYIFNLHGDPDSVPEDIDEWLDRFNVFSIYQVLPEILALWNLNTETTVEAKKNSVEPNGR